MKKTIIITLAILLIMPIIAAEEQGIKGHLTLLTVGERGNETIGGTADLELEIKPGRGRVFIDSFPLSRLDTQMTTRFSRDISCDFLDIDCSQLDFFYTIRATSSVVGGPSAGAATTILTISLLDDTRLDRNTVITGTINSGGIIGPVSGIREKAEAARRNGFNKILVPKWSIIREPGQQAINISMNETDNNVSVTYADTLEVPGIEIVGVSTIEEALYEFTGKTYREEPGEIVIPEEYQDIMRSIAGSLCDRYEDIKSQIPPETLDENERAVNTTKESVRNAREALNTSDYYSAASFCFSANSAIRHVQYSDYDEEILEIIAGTVREEIDEMLFEINNMEMRTMSELETSIIVKERLLEAKTLLERHAGNLGENLGYIEERYNSARAWAKFFDYETEKTVVLDEEYLSNACLTKIAEAEERVNYLDLLFGSVENNREELAETREVFESGDYAFCLFRATRIKADANAVLSATAVSRGRVPDLVDEKLEIARRQIVMQGENFPILGYSYYNYANSLKDTRTDLALIFSEYATEFSNLGIYFPRENGEVVLSRRHTGEEYFLIGLFLGMLLATLLVTITTVILHFRKRASRPAKKKKSRKYK